LIKSSIGQELSKNFLLGSQISFKPILKFNKNSYLKVGFFIQPTYEIVKVENRNTKRQIDYFTDLYSRRDRFNIKLRFNKNIGFITDLRNDKIDYRDKYTNRVKVGKAFIYIKKPFGTSLINFRLFRAKLDVSRTETISSAKIIHFDRPYIADASAQFLSYLRFGENFQIYGNWKYKIKYQIAIGKGIPNKSFKDAKGKVLKDLGGVIQSKGLVYGGKIIFSPIDGWEEKIRTETYFGEGKHLEFGIGFWKLPDINYIDKSGLHKIDRKLLNLEFSFHYHNLFLQTEYFKFNGFEKDFKDRYFQVGSSDGWYTKGEYIFPNFYYLAPFFSYEEWNRYKEESGYKLRSYILGLNWYLKGNNLKLGFAFQNDKFGIHLGNKEQKRFKLTFQMFF